MQSGRSNLSPKKPEATVCCKADRRERRMQSQDLSTLSAHEQQRSSGISNEGRAAPHRMAKVKEQVTVTNKRVEITSARSVWGASVGAVAPQSLA